MGIEQPVQTEFGFFTDMKKEEARQENNRMLKGVFGIAIPAGLATTLVTMYALMGIDYLRHEFSERIPVQEIAETAQTYLPYLM